MLILAASISCGAESDRASGLRVDRSFLVRRFRLVPMLGLRVRAFGSLADQEIGAENDACYLQRQCHRVGSHIREFVRWRQVLAHET
jgi:hypothetical protein